MPLLLWAMICLWVGEVQAGDIALIRISENWRFYKGVQEPSIPVEAWRQLEFDDSNWLQGPSGFRSTSSAYSPEATLLAGFGTDHSTVYFRKKFSVLQTNEIAALLLRVDYEHGFIAYLNGQEVLRRGVPGEVGSPVPYTGLASYHPLGQTEEVDLSTAIPLLRTGENILAIQLLASETVKSAALIAELYANFRRAPYIQNTTPDSTQIAWKFIQPAGGIVEFGLNTNSVERILTGLADTNQVITLTNLQPGATYQYRVGAAMAAREIFCDWRSFRTFKQSGAISFAALGDSGWGGPAQYAVAEQMRLAAPDLVMHLGDIIYYTFTRSNADFRCLSVYAEQMRTTPMFVALGNHDNLIDLTPVLETFYLPTNSVTGTEHYYSFDHGDVHFSVLWSDMDIYAAVKADYRVGSPQYNWLERDLQMTTKPWKFIFFHHVMRSSSIHGGIDDYDRNGILDEVQLQESLGALASRYGVQIIFNGHDHCYERCAPVGGPVTFVSGGGGAVPYSYSRVLPPTVQWHSRYHFLNVTADADEVLVQAVDSAGAIFDTMRLRQSLPEREVYHAAWHTPTIESAPPNDGDGNITGQRFDFAGTPIPALQGRFSSAGRLFVNNDPQFVYFGLDNVMLQPGQELFLFVENPNQPGVTALNALGNGIIDPEGEGVDGLDFLANVAFTNFAPSIGAILGDEFADYVYRSFQRPGIAFNTGQGAFALSAGLPDVLGQRIQQFNRSPQDLPWSHEQNASFIELAIPYATLGAIRPGDTLKVAAIVALTNVQTNVNLQTRDIDTGGIAYQISTNNSVVYIEGVEVRLALPLTIQILKEDDVKVRFTWNTSPGRKYQLQSSGTAGGLFTNVLDPLFPKTAAGPQDWHTISLPDGDMPARFYRIQLVP